MPTLYDEPRLKIMSFARRLTLTCCLAALLLAAIVPIVPGLLLALLILPLFSAADDPSLAVSRSQTARFSFTELLFLSIRPSRAPPNAGFTEACFSV